MLRAGRLNRRITIQWQTEPTQNEYGEEVSDWKSSVHFLEVWAAKEDLAGREYFASAQTQGETTTRFRIRYLPEVTSAYRIVCEGEAYDIQSVQDPDGRRRELILMTKRVS